MGINAAAWKYVLLSAKIPFPPRNCLAATLQATRLQCVRNLTVLSKQEGRLLHVCTSLHLITVHLQTNGDPVICFSALQITSYNITPSQPNSEYSSDLLS